MSRDVDLAVVRIAYEEAYLAKPPLVYLYFYIALSNPGPAPLWFLLPAQIGMPEAGFEWELDALSIYVLGAQDVPVGAFEGNRGLRALRLPGHGEIALSGYPIVAWGEAPAQGTLETIVTPEWVVWNRPAEAWFDRDPTTAGQARVNAEALAEDREVRATRRPSEQAARRVSFDRARRIALAVDMER